MLIRVCVNMKILLVTSNIAPQSGGPTRSVKGLCRALSMAGCDVSLLVLTGKDVFENPAGVNVIYGLQVDVKHYDIVHINGLWTLGLHSIAMRCVRANVPYIISPRGMLDPWALSVKRWKKVLGMMLYQKRTLRSAIGYHATATAEREHIERLGLMQQCIIAPNGVDLPQNMPDRITDGRLRTALFLSRLHPGKGLLQLAEAWAIVKPAGWRMRVVGPDSYGHKKEVVAKLKSLGICSEWTFDDALDDKDKWRAYRTANVLVHPSVSENFGITIAEGLAAELPVIATKGAPWQDLASENCGWWINQGVDPLVDALNEALSLTDEQRYEMGCRGRLLVERKFSWPAIAKKMIAGYRDFIA